MGESHDFQRPFEGEPRAELPVGLPAPHAEGGGLKDALGEPLSISGVSRMLGCSSWTVRQRYLPLGLPYFRVTRAGKLVFYRNQVTRWILEKQKRKGGE